MDAKYLNYYRKLGRKIAFYRSEQNFTQEQLCELVHIEPPTLSKIENGSVGISLDVLFSIAKVLHVPPYKFLEFDNN